MTERLPAADWIQRPDLAGLIAALGPGQARFVGGAVRDTLLGQPVSDIDIATRLLPPAVVDRLGAAGIRAVPTGIAHGTVTAVLAAGPVEITTLREDVETDGRHARVAFADDWRADAQRRDFTINALYADPAELTVHDYFDGLTDLADRRVRFIGDAASRIREDHLRILRYFRFDARFGGNAIDLPSERACADLAPMLLGLSRERIGMEMLKLLALPEPAPTIARMGRLGVLAIVLPEADPAGLSAVVAAEIGAGIAASSIRRLAAMLPHDPVVAEQVGARFRLSRSERKRLICAVGNSGTSDPRSLAYHIGREGAVDRLLIAGTGLDAIAGWTPPALPLTGGEILGRGVRAGPDIARILRAVEQRWIAEGFPDRERTLALLDSILAPR